MNIYDRIDEILKEKRMSRRQLAQLAGIPESSLAAAFARKSKMSMERLAKIAHALHVSPEELNPAINVMDDLKYDSERMQRHFDEQEMHVFYLSQVCDELMQNGVLDKLNSPSCMDNLYTILALALALNEEGQEKVRQYMVDINKIPEYVNVGVRVMKDKINKALEEVKPCQEDAQPTAAEPNPGSDQMDVGNADTKQA